jgi:predicted acyl esterase
MMISFLIKLGKNEQEDVIAMIQEHPLMNEYWEDKRAKAHLIQVPAYVLASMSTGLHTIGSTRCYEDIPHENKWSVDNVSIAQAQAHKGHYSLCRLRVTATQEWHDLYQQTTIADLKRFLDHYTKGVQNDWEATPKARVSVLRFNKVRTLFPLLYFGQTTMTELLNCSRVRW